jgi:lipoyl-dependent peroxiredoxin
MKRKGSAVWQGGLKDGKGSISTDSGVLRDTQYSFGTRFEQGAGTNPEELIAAAHAGCYSMALAAALTKAGNPPKRVETKAKVDLRKEAEGFRIAKIHLTTSASVTGIDSGKFREVAEQAKINCPVSKVLSGAEITLDAKLAS